MTLWTGSFHPPGSHLFCTGRRVIKLFWKGNRDFFFPLPSIHSFCKCHISDFFLKTILSLGGWLRVEKGKKCLQSSCVWLQAAGQSYKASRGDRRNWDDKWRQIWEAVSSDKKGGKSTQEMLLERKILEEGTKAMRAGTPPRSKEWRNSRGRKQETQGTEGRAWNRATAYRNNLFIAVGYKMGWLWLSWEKWKREHAVDWYWRSKHPLPFGLLRLQLSVASTRKVTSVQANTEVILCYKVTFRLLSINPSPKLFLFSELSLTEEHQNCSIGNSRTS